MSAKHTPGPWAVDPELNDFDFGAPQKGGTRMQLCRYVHAPEGGGGRIAQCFANCLVKTTPEMEANARLIAAAPDLLQAAKAVAFSNGFDAALPEKMNALRAAIAAATGELPR